MILYLLFGCGEACLPKVGVAMTVCTVDGDFPVMADAVTWTRAEDDPAYDGPHALECADPTCSIWHLKEIQDGSVLITGTRTDSPVDDTSCEIVAADTRQVALHPDQRLVMDLPLVIEGPCP